MKRFTVAVLLLIPMLLWPMMLLVVALGGIRSLIRFDLMMLTIAKTFPAYALVVVFAYVGVVGPALLPEDVGLAAWAALLAVEVYAGIFTMRVIGLYYHHFKNRFAWSWG
jgi:prepilin signal peptidase PulO-like enzyme (type II secretory pathway)